MDAISSKGTANMSWSTKASRSAGLSASNTTSRASPTESANSAACSGSVPSGGPTTGSGRWVSSGCWWRVVRERSRLSATRATIVVSQPPKFSTALVSARLTRSHASWTASSASDNDPSIR